MVEIFGQVLVSDREPSRRDLNLKEMQKQHNLRPSQLCGLFKSLLPHRFGAELGYAKGR